MSTSRGGLIGATRAYKSITVFLQGLVRQVSRWSPSQSFFRMSRNAPPLEKRPFLSGER